MKTLQSLTLALALIAPGVGHAAPSALDIAARQQSGAANDPGSGTAGTGFVISGGENDGRVSFTLGRNWTGGGDQTAMNNLAFKVSAPFNKDTKEGPLFLGDGLANDTSLEGSYTRVFAGDLGPAMSDNHVKSILLRAAANCRATFLAKTPNATEAAIEANAKACKTKTVRAFEADGDLTDEKDVQFLKDSKFLNANIWLFGVSGGISHNGFDYRDPVTFAQNSDEHTSFNLAAYVGGVPFHELLYFGAGAEYRREYVAADKRELCHTPAGGTQECFTDPFAPPERKKTTDVFAVVRYKNETAFETPVGFELKSAYDFEDDVFAATASLFLVTEDDKKLQGGLRVRWQSSDHDPLTKDQHFTVGLFLNTPLSVFASGL